MPNSQLKNWLDHREQRRTERWNRPQSANQLRSWRTVKRQRLLIRAYYLLLAVGLIFTILQLFTVWAQLAWVIIGIGICVIWTMLRITINAKDSAPIRVLDEYEIGVLDRWRRLAHPSMEWTLVIISSLMIWVSVSAMKNGESVLGIPTYRWLYTCGLLVTVTILAFASLPAVGYALTIGPDNPLAPSEEDNLES